jgi:large subunit ribosomal protein L30
MSKIKITQVRSVIGRPKDQKATMIALGLKKMNQSVEQVPSPEILGMVRKVNHLVRVENI